MLIIEKKKHMVTFRTIWCAKEPVKRAGINRYRYACFHGTGEYEVKNTLVSYLTEDEESIVSHISKNGRYEIRRAAKENVVCECKIGKELTANEIRQFADFFQKFWESKGRAGVKTDDYIREIEEYAKQEAIAIATARLGEKILVYHTYIVGDDFVRLYQSASQFRLEEEIPHQLIGMANRLLHKEDMLFFKRQGKKIYDWGGAGKGEEVASITKFKESFGGQPMQVYDFEEVVGWKAKIVKKVIRLLEKF